MPIPRLEIQTARLLLRPISASDAPALAEVYAHPDVSRYLSALDVDATARQVAGFTAEWEQRGYGILSVFHRATGHFIGRSGLHFWPQLDEVEVGWVLSREAWGNGYATEAGVATLAWGFREHGLPAIVAIVAKENTGSLAVAERLQMSVLREDHIFGLPVTVFRKTRAGLRRS